MERLTEKDYKGNKLVLKNAVECVSDDLKEWSISTSTTGTQTIRGYAVDKLAEYEDLEEQGKLLKLHCKAGDIVYALLGVPAPSKYVIYPAEVKEICFGVYGNRRTIKYRLEPMRYRGRILDFYSDDYEKKFFLEESEAESALQKMNEMEGKNGN